MSSLVPTLLTLLAQAEHKISVIFNAVKTSVPWDVVAVRKANVVSIHSKLFLEACYYFQFVLTIPSSISSSTYSNRS